CYAVANLFDQIAMVQADPFVASTIKALLVSLFALAVLILSRNRLGLSTKSRSYWKGAARIYIAAGVVSEVIGTAAFLQAMKVGGINIATPMVQTWVIWSAIGSVLFLKEKVHAKTFIGLALALVGLLGLTYFQQRGIPFTPDWPKGIPYGLVAALGWAGSTILIRKGQTEGINRYVGMFMQFTAALVGLLIVIALTQRGNLFAQIPTETYLYLILSAIVAGVLGMICMYTALKLSPIEKVVPIIAGYPVLAALGGALFLGNYLNLGMMGGIVLVAAGVAVCQGRVLLNRRRRS
ncbi:DMT family transporter, partial [Candidatus Bipolaricaulota bacterium]|nr:DMT family transporter [Candidatus Bipolaricaulota bacterium]